MYADDQLNELMSMPNIPANVIDAAKQFPQHVKNLEKTRAVTMVAQWRTADQEKTQAASQQVSDDHKRLEELASLVESGKATAGAVLGEVSKIESRIKDAQRRHAALVNSEGRYAAIEADPSAYFDDFYGKYSGLRDRRMNLRDYLAERGLSRQH
ncbi:hypothetical protein [Aeromicrobium sp.]|uniref:hypothetical protein n=1 Tax=Aeromicrobium sp. TaxID=1871063 RepID=UPI0030C1BADE